MRLFAIEEIHIKSLQAWMKRLYTEERMNGDEMRNCAQTIEAVVRLASQMKVPGE